MNRLRNLWRLSGVEIPKHSPTLSEKLIRAITGKREATIVETADLPDLFETHDPAELPHPSTTPDER